MRDMPWADVSSVFFCGSFFRNYGLLSQLIFSIMIKNLTGGEFCLTRKEDQEEEIMQEMIKVAVDAMGGDNAPDEIIKGAVEAVSLREDIKVFLVGKEELIREKLKAYSYKDEQVEIVNATEIIEMAEPPVAAIRKKKDSSIVVGMKLVKEGKADAFVSAGSSGAVLVGGQLLVIYPPPERRASTIS